MHPASRVALLWGGATTGLVGAAMILIGLRGHLPDSLTILLANVLGSIAAIGLYQSLRLLCQRSPQTHVALLMGFAVVCAHLVLGSDYQQQGPRLMLTSVTQGLCAALVLPMLMARRRLDAPMPLNWSIAVMACFALLNIARFVAVARNGVPANSDTMTSGQSIQVVAVVLYALIPMAFALSFIGIVNGRLAGELRRIAVTDSLTGLLTRRGFHEQAARMLARTDDRAIRPTCLMMLDLDHFKTINDRYGHAAGDQVLVHFGQMIREIMPADAVSGRHGGEEFCVISECSTEDSEEGRRLGELVRKHVHAAPIQVGEHQIDLSVSIGVAMSPHDGSQLEALLAAADRRLYVAKACGRNCVAVDDRNLPPLPKAPARQEALPA